MRSENGQRLPERRSLPRAFLISHLSFLTSPRRGDVIAQGIVEGVRQVGVTVPLVVRLKGTNQEEGRRILRESGIDLIAADTLDEAAQAVVAAARERGTRSAERGTGSD